MKFYAALTIILASTTHAFAEQVDIEACTTNINGETVSIDYDLNAHWSGPNPWLYEHYTMREILLSGWGDITCPSAITMAHLAPEILPNERADLCLIWDDEANTYLGFANGARDAYGICKDPKTVCERVGETEEWVKKQATGTAGALTGLLAGAAGTAAGTSSVAAAAGVTAVTHSSGAAILTGSTGYVAGSMGTMGTSLLAGGSAIAGVLTAPATLTVAAITAAGIGGATYLCWEEISEE